MEDTVSVPTTNEINSNTDTEIILEETQSVPPLPQPPKVRRDFYQTESEVVVTLLAKNLKKEEVNVNFAPETLTVEAKLADGSDYTDKLSLFHPINPAACSYKVLSTKIEIHLRKLDASSWPSLEAAVVKPVSNAATVSYPTSAKKKLDWGKVEKEIEKEIPEDEDVNNLFAKIFSSGDENTKRAMMKSMQESGGTVLSTNWEDVGKKKVECSPPDGMEWKKWDASTEK